MKSARNKDDKPFLIFTARPLLILLSNFGQTLDQGIFTLSIIIFATKSMRSANTMSRTLMRISSGMAA